MIYKSYNCTSLTSVTIGNSVTSIGGGAFDGCSGLTSVEFHCKTIGSWWFGGFSSITLVMIGDEVTSIGNRAFAYCSSLTSVTIGNSMTSIGDGAFGGCINLKEIFCHATTPPSCYNSGVSGVFTGVNQSACKLYVPQGCLSKYQSAPYWKEFFILEEIPTGVGQIAERDVQIHASDGFVSVSGIADGQPIAVYRTDGTQVASGTTTDGTATLATNLSKGSVAIVKVGGKSVKILMR